MSVEWMIGLAALTSLHGAAARDGAPVWCTKGDGTPCSAAELSDPVRYRQVLLMPTGFTQQDERLFRDSFDQYIVSVSQIPDAVYSSRYQSRMLYVGFWVPGGALGTPETTFGGQVMPHPVRGKALTVDQQQVIEAVGALQVARPEVRPWAVMIVFNTTDGGITSNAAPPSFLQSPYGIAKCTRNDIEAHYVPMHEMAHAGLNYLDEYREPGFEKMSLSILDYLTPLALMDGTWGGWTRGINDLFGVYSFKVSEVLAANGNDNIDVSRYPSRVATAGYVPREYEYEGGFFFGLGTYHNKGKNIMNSDFAAAGPEDGFAYDMSESQREVVRDAFDHPGVSERPNDRLRNAGPHASVPWIFGSESHVMLYDGDKNHHYHPTQRYDVQVGWYERHWKTCWKWGFVPYPCYDTQWSVAQKAIAPELRNLELKPSALYGLANLAQSVLCGLGIDHISSGGGNFNLCQESVGQMTDAFIPTVRFAMPYQDVTVPTTQWWTKYYWRFRTDNGTMASGWTGWADFYRSL